LDSSSSPPGDGPPSPTEAILESISDGVFTVDPHWRITSFNRAAEQITGVPRKEALGRLCAEVFRSSMCETDCALRHTLATGEPVVGRTGFIVDAEGGRVPISLSTAVLRDAQGRYRGGAETFRDLSEVEGLRRRLRGRSEVGGLTSHAPAMRQVLQILPTVARSPSTILLQGETGTGKEVVARAIHALSPRRRGPFVAVNCAALPETLLESELFGYKSGAFTGAHRDKPGRFALARGGTLFLDEIAEMGLSLQVRLLRVLQERRFEPLGGVRSEETDARIVVATHRDLAAEVERGSFRRDLFYRIHVVRLELPPLRERKEDIPLLVDRFVERFNDRQGREVPGCSAEALSLLMAHDWPGNIRELENVVERAFVLCGSGPIDLGHLPEELTALHADSAGASPLRRTHDLVDAAALRRALARHRGHRAAAARELGIHKSTLLRRMKRLGVTPPGRDGRSRT
jgi:PAS domain S-box-containing protein